LEGKLESDRYESRVSQLKRSRKTTQEELEHIRNRTTRIERLEQDRDALLSHYSQVAVEHLDNLEPEERNRVYKMLDLKVLAHEDGYLEVKWTLGGNLCRDNEPLPPGSCRTRGR
jgi:DNA repair ATPase RecN